MRRGDGIYTDPRTGRFVARYVDAHGRRRAKSFDLKRDAQAWRNKGLARADEVRRALDEGRPVPSAPAPRQAVLLRDFAEDWYKRTKPEIAHSTRIRYEQHVDWIKAGPLGALAIEEVTFREVEAWLAAIANETVAGKDGKRVPRYGYHSVKGMLDILKRMVMRAQLENGVPSWSWDTVRIPKTVRQRKGKKRSIFEARELGAFLTALEAPRFRQRSWRAVFWIMAATGCRPCEALALRRRHVDLEAGILRFETSAYRSVVRDGTKTGDPRQPAIPPDLAAVLREHLARVPDHPDALLFPADVDGPPRPQHGDSLKKPFQAALKAAGVQTKGLTPYSLRHTFNSMAHRLGADGIVLRDIMGHSSAAMTERYKNTSHVERAKVQEQVLDAVRH